MHRNEQCGKEHVILTTRTVGTHTQDAIGDGRQPRSARFSQAVVLLRGQAMGAQPKRKRTAAASRGRDPPMRTTFGWWLRSGIGFLLCIIFFVPFVVADGKVFPGLLFPYRRTAQSASPRYVS